jgi:hypothetical protein
MCTKANSVARDCAGIFPTDSLTALTRGSRERETTRAHPTGVLERNQIRPLWAEVSVKMQHNVAARARQYSLSLTKTLSPNLDDNAFFRI